MDDELIKSESIGPLKDRQESRWAVCKDPIRNADSPQLAKKTDKGDEPFMRKEDAERWQNEIVADLPTGAWDNYVPPYENQNEVLTIPSRGITRKDQGWWHVVPVDSMSSHQGAPYRGQLLRESSLADRISDVQASDFEGDVDDLCNNRDHGITCELKGDWKFEEIAAAAYAIPGGGHRFRGMKISSLSSQLALSAYDLEFAVARCNPYLSTDGVAAFLSSWTVWRHLAVLAGKIYREMGLQEKTRTGRIWTNEDPEFFVVPKTVNRVCEEIAVLAGTLKDRNPERQAERTQASSEPPKAIRNLPLDGTATQGELISEADRIRKSCHLTWTEFAIQVGLAPKTLERFRKMKSIPRASTTQKVETGICTLLSGRSGKRWPSEGQMTSK